MEQDTEGQLLIETTPDHGAIPFLKDMQRERHTGHEYQTEGKHGQARHPSTPRNVVVSAAPKAIIITLKVLKDRAGDQRYREEFCNSSSRALTRSHSDVVSCCAASFAASCAVRARIRCGSV